MKFFYYIFYRIIDSRYYQKVEKKDAWIFGMGITTSCQAMNLNALLISLFGENKNEQLSIKEWLFIFTGLFVINLFLLTNKKYLALKERWKDETHRTLKGWGVVLYTVGSLALFIFALFFFKP